MKMNFQLLLTFIQMDQNWLFALDAESYYTIVMMEN